MTGHLWAIFKIPLKPTGLRPLNKELPVFSVLTWAMGEINVRRKNSQPFGSSYAPVSCGRPRQYLSLSWKDSAEFPVWCSFSCWGNLRSEAGSWQRRKEAAGCIQKPGGWRVAGRHSDGIITLHPTRMLFSPFAVYFEAGASSLRQQ